MTQQPPTTGNPQVDAALAGLADLDQAPLAEQHDALAQAQDALAAVLDARGAELQRPIFPRQPR